jgi:UDP-GlcNAc3NAcA epimerase
VKRLVTIVGARPQFIKAAMLSRVLAKRTGLEECLLHTGQHYDHGMSEVFFTELGLPRPKFNLGIGGGTQGAMTGRQLEGIESVLQQERPDCVVVYGDTNSTLAGALAAAKLHIPVAHVEAGLRSFNRRMPEEVNRVLTDHVSDFLFTPTRLAGENLAAEGVRDGVHFVGDIMFDASILYSRGAKEAAGEGVRRIIETLGGFALVTIHRQENTDLVGRLEVIFEALRRLATDLAVVLPIHPRLHKTLVAGGHFEEMTRGLTVIDPVGFIDMLALLQASSLVLTDSGGLQKEAFYAGKPVIILRDETEWVELLEIGCAALCPPIAVAGIVSAALRMVGRPLPDTDQTPYGIGDTATRIADILQAAL